LCGHEKGGVDFFVWGSGLITPSCDRGKGGKGEESHGWQPKEKKSGLQYLGPARPFLRGILSTMKKGSVLLLGKGDLFTEGKAFSVFRTEPWYHCPGKKEELALAHRKEKNLGGLDSSWKGGGTSSNASLSAFYTFREKER